MGKLNKIEVIRCPYCGSKCVVAMRDPSWDVR